MAQVYLLESIAKVEKEINERIEKALEIKNSRINSLDDLKALQLELGRWVKYNSDLFKKRFSDESIAREHESFLPTETVEFSSHLPSKIERFRELVALFIHSLQSILERLPLMEERLNKPIPPNNTSTTTTSRNIFIVHGRDEAAKQAVARFLAKLKLNPIILHEQPTGGSSTVAEKLERYSDVGFAVILLTPDDVGYLKDKPDEAKPRARQNVILELGYFWGRLKRKNVCALYKEEIELPTDYEGVVYIPMDKSEGWKLSLPRKSRTPG